MKQFSFFCIKIKLDDKFVTVTDVFCDTDYFYSKGYPIAKETLYKRFHDIKCKVATNYEQELVRFYGKNYKNIYVMWNHKICLTKKSTKKLNITINKEEYKKICEKYKYDQIV